MDTQHNLTTRLLDKDVAEEARQYCFANGVEEKREYITWLGMANSIAIKKWHKNELMKYGARWKAETKVTFFAYTEQFIKEHPEIEVYRALGEVNG